MTILDGLAAAGLTGRGGAAFRTAIKVRAAHHNGADLIVNACDGEVGAAKDGWVVAHHLDELVRGAALVTPGRRQTVRYAAHRGSGTEQRLRAAGVDVLGAPARYVSSEETSLISLAHGGLARPMTKRAPFVFGGVDSRGRRIRPTVVLNAETLWRVAQIADHGPEWFRSVGTPDEPGPRLVTITGHVSAPGVVETSAGVSLADLLDSAGGLAPQATSILVGGLGGAFLTAGEARGAVWSGPGLAAYGAYLGPGVIEVIDPSSCPLAVVDRMLSYAAGESAGQCGPCMFGLPAIAADWHELTTRPSHEVLTRLRDRLGVVSGRGACHFPDGVARFAASALRVFGPHLDLHVTGSCSRARRLEHVPAR